MTNNSESRIRISGFLYPKLSYEIQGAFYNVFNKYGPGLKEKIYENALSDELDMKKINYIRQKRINIYSIDTGKILGAYVPDLVVSDKIIIEVKAADFTIRKYEQQQRSYLKASQYEVAYLVNFGTPRLYIKRSIYTNDRKPFIVKLNS